MSHNYRNWKVSLAGLLALIGIITECLHFTQ